MQNYLVTRPDLASFRLLKPSSHARERLAERNILESWANIVAAFGVWSMSYRCQLTGMESIFCVPDASERIKATIGIEVDRDELELLHDLVVVVSPDGRRLITAFFNDN